MIKITVTEEGIPMVWNSEDWVTLRNDHRIVGSLCGTLASFPCQDRFHGLPFILLPYEATLLREKRIARLVRYPSLTRAPGKGVKEEYEKYLQRICDEQMKSLKRDTTTVDTKLQISEENQEKPSISKISNKCRVRRKAESDLGKTTHPTLLSLVLEKTKKEDLKEIAPLAASLNVQTFTTYPWLRKEDACSVKWKYPSTAAEILRFKVFKDFWEKGYYVSSAHKFGGDFLIYAGDPYTYKAHFVVICIERNAAIRPIDVAVLCRLGDALGKSVVLACETNNDEITYQTVKCSILSQ